MDLKKKKAEIAERIQRLSLKLGHVTAEARNFGPKLVRRGLKVYGLPRHGMIKMWHRNALISMRQIRKKIYKLKAELDKL